MQTAGDFNVSLHSGYNRAAGNLARHPLAAYSVLGRKTDKTQKYPKNVKLIRKNSGIPGKLQKPLWIGLEGNLCRLKVKPPRAEHVLWMRVRRCKKAFDTNPGINFLSKTSKFRSVHFAADIFSQTPFQPCFLCGARRYSKNNLVISFIDIVPHDYRPRKMTQCPDKTMQPLFTDVEPVYDIPGCHSGNTTPYHFVDFFCR